MTEPPNDLKKRIADAKAKDEGTKEAKPGRKNTASNGTGMALRASTDLVAGLVVGGFLGYVLDQWLNTKPWFMIIMFFIGFIAGFVNIYRWQTGQEYKIGFKQGQKEQQNSVDHTEE